LTCVIVSIKYVITGMAFFFIWRNYSVSILPPGVKAFTDQRPYRDLHAVWSVGAEGQGSGMQTARRTMSERA
jgi:hypothetical protein